MIAFHGQFQPDAEHPGVVRWITDKPIFRHAVVRFTPPFQEQNAVPEPTVKVEANGGNPVVSAQENAWKTILADSTVIEDQLRQKLFTHHSAGYRGFVTELVEDLDEWELDDWNAMKDTIDWESPVAIEHLYQLDRITLFDHGPDDCGYCAFDFHSGWAEEHGVSILMHQTQVLAGGQIAEFCNRGSLTEYLSHLQSKTSHAEW